MIGNLFIWVHGRMARGSLGLPKVSPRPTMPYPYGLMTVSGATILYPLGHPTPYAYDFFSLWDVRCDGVNVRLSRSVTTRPTADRLSHSRLEFIDLGIRSN
jgi:hypothetical protein